MNRRHFIKTSALGAAAGLTMPAVSTAGKVYEWKMASSFPKDLPGVGTSSYHLKTIIEQMSGQRIRIRYFGPGEMAGSFKAFDAVSEGKAEIGLGGPYYWREKHEGFIFCTNLPFGMNAVELISWIQFGGGWALMDEIYGQFNLKPFPYGNSGVQMGGWYKNPIRTIDDFKGLKIRTPGLGGEILAKLGARIIMLPVTKIAAALESGEIDAAEWIAPFDDMKLQFYKNAPYYHWPGWQEPGALADCFVNKDAYNALPSDLQEIIKQACLATYNYMLSEYASNNGRALVELVARHQVRLTRFPDRVLMELAKLSKKTLADIAGRDPLSKKIYDSVMAFTGKAVGWNQIGEEAFSLARSMSNIY